MTLGAPDPMSAIKAVASISNERLLADVLAHRGRSDTTGISKRSLLVTAVLFLGLGGYYWGWVWVVIVALAILLHEMGHVIAMRLFGYRNVRILFIPLLGGLASGEPRELHAAKDALIALAGPAFGIATAALVAVIAYVFQPQPWLVNFAWGALFINALNLVPLVPLDGGRFVNDALFSRIPVLELAFRLVAAGGLGWWAWKTDAVFFGIIAAFLLLTTSSAFRRARALRDARRDPFWQTAELDLDAVARLRQIATTAHSTMSPDLFNEKLPELVHGIWMEIQKKFPGPVHTVLLIAGFLATCASVIVVARLFANYLGRPHF